MDKFISQVNLIFYLPQTFSFKGNVRIKMMWKYIFFTPKWIEKKEKKTIWKRPQAKGRRFCNGGHSFHLVMLTRPQICCNNAMSPRWYVSNCDIDLTGDICPSTSCSLVLWVTMTILLISFFQTGDSLHGSADLHCRDCRGDFSILSVVLQILLQVRNQ